MTSGSETNKNYRADESSGATFIAVSRNNKKLHAYFLEVLEKFRKNKITKVGE